MVCTGGPYYAHPLLPWYKEYLHMMGRNDTEASARILSSQLKKYPQYIRRVPGKRRAKGLQFVLRGHPTFDQ